jgi:chorismate dehydratase
MTSPIAMIPYANMAPFQEMGPPTGCSFISLTPRQSVTALQQKQVWAAAVPVGGLAALAGQVSYLGRFGIAAREEVMSVLFFSDRPLDEFRHPLTVRLTGESASSVRLLYLLLGYRHGFDHLPLRESGQRKVHGELQIGDTALTWAKSFSRDGAVKKYGYVTDLAAKWYEAHGLPFVFARWVVHRDAPEQVQSVLMQWLQDYQSREQDLIRQATAKVAARFDLPYSYAQRYLKTIRRCLTDEDEAGQACFANELNKHMADPLFVETGPTSPSF